MLRENRCVVGGPLLMLLLMLIPASLQQVAIGVLCADSCCKHLYLYPDEKWCDWYVGVATTCKLSLQWWWLCFVPTCCELVHAEELSAYQSSACRECVVAACMTIMQCNAD